MALQCVELQCTKTMRNATLTQYEFPVDNGNDSGGPLTERYTSDKGNSISISYHSNHGPKLF